MPLEVRLFGGFAVAQARQPVVFATNAARALLAYLAAESDRAHPRETLAGLLWPNQSQASAQANLRMTLSRVRKSLADAPGALEVCARTIQFAPAAASVDIARFDELMRACESHSHPDLVSCAECAPRLREAVALYAGDLLSGFAYAASPEFEEWLLQRREHAHQRALTALDALACNAQNAGDFERLRALAFRQLRVDPLRETAHAQAILALAELGRRAEALAQVESCRAILQRELGIEPGPEVASLAEKLKASAPRVSLTLTLPTDTAPFVGRERELAALVERLTQPDVRLVTLCGPGGIGKSRLAVEGVRQATLVRPELHADGSAFVGLAGWSDASEVPAAVALTLGVTVRDGDSTHAVLNALKTSRIRLILDNFEHVMAATPFVVDLLGACPALQLVVTSREPLNLRSEHVWQVPHMDCTDDIARPSSAVRLFASAARNARADFRADADNVADIARICRVAGCAPLGIELAAGWAELIPLADIAREMERSLDFLSRDWADMPPRHRSMRAVFEWSWNLLDEAERRALSWLSVFRGGFTRQAALEVTGVSLATLAKLSRKSLVSRSETGDGAGRFVLHELLRQFAEEKLSASPAERERAEQSHSRLYLSFMAGLEQRMVGEKPREAAAILRADIDNALVAWRWAAAHNDLDRLDESLYCLSQFFIQSGLSAEAEAVIAFAVGYVERALAEAEARDDNVEARRCRGVLSHLLAHLCAALVTQSKFEATTTNAQRAMQLAEQDGNQRDTAFSLFQLAYACNHLGEFEAGRSHAERALKIFDSAQQAGGAMSTEMSELPTRILLVLCATSLALDDTAAARRHLLQAMSASATHNSARWLAACRSFLASVLINEGQLDAAEAEFERALAATRSAGYRWLEGNTLRDMADVFRLRGDVEGRRRALRAALIVFREIGDRSYSSNVLVQLGQLALSEGDTASAREWLLEALHLSRALGLRHVAARAEALLVEAVSAA